MPASPPWVYNLAVAAILNDIYPGAGALLLLLAVFFGIRREHLRIKAEEKAKQPPEWKVAQERMYDDMEARGVPSPRTYRARRRAALIAQMRPPPRDMTIVSVTDLPPDGPNERDASSG